MSSVFKRWARMLIEDSNLRARPDRNNNAQGSPTPILELLEPLPQPADRVVTGRFALPFLVLVGMTIFTENHSFLVVPFGYLLIAAVDVAVHEFGHLLAGWCAGLSFTGVDVGPLSIDRIRGRWAFRLRPRIYRGQARMSLTRIRRMRRQLAILVLGGPLVSFVFGMSACLLGEVFRTGDSLGWTTFSEFLGAFSILTGVMSSIPFHTSAGGNDAFLLRQLLCSRPVATQMIAAYALDAVISAKSAPPEYYQRWWRLASLNLEPAQFAYYRDWNLYKNAENTTAAAECLERMLRDSSWMPETLRNHLVSEAAYFSAWHRSKPAESEVWFGRMAQPGWLDPISRSRVEIAMLAARKHYEEALAKCESTIAFLNQHVTGPVSKQMQADWQGWRIQIEQRMRSDSSVVNRIRA